MLSRLVRRISGPCRLHAAAQRSRLPALLLAGVAVMVNAGAAAAEARHAAMILDANTGAVLHAQSAEDLRHPASLTKMMTLYMAFELIEMGRLSYTTKIKVTQEAASAAPTKLDLEPGEEIALIDAMKALVTKSANDMAIAIAQTIGGSEQNFARLMTEKAHLLGMKSTVFRNASGLPDDAQVTTARDMATLALHLQDDFPKHYHLFGLRSFTYQGATYRNHNTLLNSYRGTDGIKTGYTRASGFNLVASVRRDGKHLIGVIFGGETAAARNAHLRVLLDRALQKASTSKTRKPALVAKAAPPPVKAQKPVAVAKAEPPTAAIVPQPKPALRPSVTKDVEIAKAEPAKAEPVLAGGQANAAPKSIFRTLPTGETPTASLAAAPVAVASAASSAAEPAATGMPAGVQVAKVRRVMVAPRVKPAVDAVADLGASEPAAGDTAAPRSVADLLAADSRSAKPAAQVAAAPAPATNAPASGSETIVTKAAGLQVRQPSTFQDQVAALAANIAPAAFVPRQPDPIGVMAAAPADAPAPPAAAASETPAPAKVASAAPLAPAYRLAGPAPQAAAPAAKGAFQIQIGAYGSASEAERQLATVGASAQPIVAGHAPVTLPVAKANRQLYRARFAGFEANAAANACLELRRRQIDCFVMKGE